MFPTKKVDLLREAKRNISEAMTTRKSPKGQKQKNFQPLRDSGVSRPKRGRNEGGNSSQDNWLYGDHAVMAALANPNRKIKRLLLTKSKRENLKDHENDLVSSISATETVLSDQLKDILPENAIHQGIALLANPLHNWGIEDVPKICGDDDFASVAVLDQVTDPHNVGAVLRSAAAFGISAIIMPDRHSPPITGVMARSASGAVEMVPIIRVNNLSRALDILAEFGFWRIGMDGQADKDLDDTVQNVDKVALVLGSEGKGLRRLTAEKCDLLGKLPMSGKIESLNVSNAAAIAFYELTRRKKR